MPLPASKYGSVTFNQFGREMPFGGMNEAGLVIENMWLDDTLFPAVDARPEVNMLQWIQYQLDNYSSVKEVIESDKKIRLENTPARARIHYLICDARGNSAAIEFLNGSMQVHRGKDFPYHALANTTYEKSAAALRDDASRIEVGKPLAHTDSISRFCRAAGRVKAFELSKNPTQDVAYAFETLNQVRQGDYTVWQIVYDISSRQIYFHTRNNTRDHRIDLKSLDFGCNRPVEFADIQSDASALEVVEFHKLAEADHRKYLDNFYGQDSLKRALGDLTPLVEPLLLTVRSYKCAAQ